MSRRVAAAEIYNSSDFYSACAAGTESTSRQFHSNCNQVIGSCSYVVLVVRPAISCLFAAQSRSCGDSRITSLASPLSVTPARFGISNFSLLKREDSFGATAARLIQSELVAFTGEFPSPTRLYCSASSAKFDLKDPVPVEKRSRVILRPCSSPRWPLVPFAASFTPRDAFLCVFPAPQPA